MKHTLFLTLAIIFLNTAFGQENLLDPNVRFAKTITGEDISTYLHVLASDEFEGRETGTSGNKKAAEYIVSQIKSFGIPPIPGTDSYYQDLAFTRMKWNSITATINENELQHQRDYLMIPPLNTNDKIEIDAAEIIFLGYGIDDVLYSDYRKNDVAGKVVIVYGGEPIDEEGNYMLTGTTVESKWSTDYSKKLVAANKAGVKFLIVISNNLRQDLGKYRSQLIGGTMMMGSPEKLCSDFVGNMKISTKAAKELLGKKLKKVIKARKKLIKKGKLKPVRIKCLVKISADKQIKSMPGVNILGYIEGSDPHLKKEVVVISAHFDHIGTRGEDVYNGADDNGSGTSGVLEIAQAFMKAKKEGKGTRRSVLCLWVTGEEKGLLGSQYYAENPIFSLENTVADINIDMIGRIDDKHTDPNYIYVIGSDRLSTELHDINEMVNKKYTHLELDYTYNAKDDPNRFYYRSDHYNFAKNGIPSVFFFSGVHEDYHRPTDTVDKIMFDKAAKISRLAFYTAWELANRLERIKVNVRGGT